VVPEVTAEGTFRLFVYGTLKRGGRRHRLLAGQRFLGEALTRPRYALLDLSAYPGLVPAGAEGQAVQGELYEVAIGLLARLDAEEGAPELFRLGPVEVQGWAGPAYAYFYQPPAEGLPRCPAGRWEDTGRRER
jgi:gamma-glutamylcyclotransferase (GGCT)/AIG2-like uncharacterized protein YtfP